MDKVQEAQVLSYRKTSIFLTDQAALLLPTIAKVAPIKPLLDAQLLLIDQNQLPASQNNTGIAETKNGFRGLLLEDAMVASYCLVDLAVSLNNSIMRGLVEYVETDLTGMSDYQFKESCDRLLGQVNTNITALKDPAIGYTIALQATFASHLTSYNGLIAKPREAIDIASAYNAEVDKNIRDIAPILDKLDIQINKIRYSNNLLYNEYYACRRIDSFPTTGSGVKFGSLAAGEQKKIDNITYDAATQILLESTGASKLEFTLRTNDGLVLGVGIQVENGVPLTVVESDLAPSGVALWVKNLSATLPGSYKTTIL